MRNPRAGLEAILGLVAPLMAGGACLQSSLSIDTTALTFSGCYQQSMYAGLYETLVWTIEGRDIAPTGTKAISASHINGDEGDPVWTIGTVISNPQNTWSDGFSAGLEVVDIVCTGTSAFWETEDPSEEIQWACDTNGDGVRSVAESGDFETVVCGCPDAAGNIATPAPTAGVQLSTQAPAPAIVEPTTAPVSAIERTVAPIPAETALTPNATQTTPAPLVGGGGNLAPVAMACNITLSSPDLQDVSGCYIGRASSNSRAKWVKFDESASIEWQENGAARRWVVLVAGFGAPDETKCYASKDVEDPTEIPKMSWTCDLDGRGSYTPALSFEFDGLECSGACDITTSAGAVDEDSSSGSTGRTIAIAIGSAVSGIGLAALIIIGLVLMRRRRGKTRGAGSKAVGAAKTDAPADPNAAPVVPVFEPWGTRPAPRYYG